MLSADKVDLCDGCKEVDFEQIFTSSDIPAKGRKISTIQKRPVGSKTLKCQLCLFFHRTKPERPTKKQHIRLYDRTEPPASDLNRESTVPRQPFLCMLQEGSRVEYGFGMVPQIRMVGVVTYIANDCPKNSEIKPVGARVDFELLKAQLEKCNRSCPSPRKQDAPDLELQYIYLIDCTDEQIVKRTLEQDYMALSYVWGPQTHANESDSSLTFSFDKAPRTVRDAVRVVRKLGKRYLWVDRFCINQNDAAEKDMMLRHMDLIYENSYGTIVALSGENDKAGLPGVSSSNRIPQASFETKKGSLIWSLPSISKVISDSTWNTRGWTYQEARLSRCCLFFSDYQVYCVDKESAWSEAIPFDPSTSTVAKLMNSATLDGALFGAITAIPEGLFLDRFNYTRRCLTYQDDILSAFFGTSRRSSFVSFLGIPIAPPHLDVDPHTSFALGQLWRKIPSHEVNTKARTSTIARCDRRQGFPTWTWASVIADIRQDTASHESLYGQYIRGIACRLPENEAQTKFWHYVDGTQVPLHDTLSCADPTTTLRENPNLLIEGDLLLLRHRTRGPKKKWYHLHETWIPFQPDLHIDDGKWPEKVSEEDPEGEELVLILVQWNDMKDLHMRWLLLMVIKWTDEDHAERVGLLTEYRHEFPVEWIYESPRMRKRFVLQ